MLREAREALERDLVRRALNLHAGNISAAAQELGISRPTLYELIEKLHVKRPEGEGLIDGAVDGGAAGAQETSDAFRQMQSGNIRSYAGWVAVGATAVIAFMVWRGLR